MYRGAPDTWSTRDGIIPFRLFYALLAELRTARRPLADAVHQGIERAFGGTSPGNEDA